MEFGMCVPHYGKPVDIERILGVARSAGQRLRAEALLAQADAAMYQAKQAGKDTYRLAQGGPLRPVVVAPRVRR